MYLIIIDISFKIFGIIIDLCLYKLSKKFKNIEQP